MTEKRVDYDQLAPTYNQRFTADRSSGVARALVDLVNRRRLTSVLEVGCGTGHWLAGLAPLVARCYGLDLSRGMLRHAQERSVDLKLVQGDAATLSFPSAEFELVYCVNAIHHFDDPFRFCREAHRVLSPGGWLAVLGSDPHGKPDRWYGYHYFPSTYQTDLDRFPGEEQLGLLFAGAGFAAMERRTVDEIREIHTGRDVLTDPFIHKCACSQLVLLGEAEYAAGLLKIVEDIERAEELGEQIEFKSAITVMMWSGRKV